MAINTVYEVVDLEMGTRKLWKSMDFLLEMVDEAGEQMVTAKNFNERWRTKPDSVKGVIFKNRWRVTVEYLWGMIAEQRTLHPLSGARDQKAHDALKASGALKVLIDGK